MSDYNYNEDDYYDMEFNTLRTRFNNTNPFRTGATPLHAASRLRQSIDGSSARYESIASASSRLYEDLEQPNRHTADSRDEHKSAPQSPDDLVRPKQPDDLVRPNQSDPAGADNDVQHSNAETQNASDLNSRIPGGLTPMVILGVATGFLGVPEGAQWWITVQTHHWTHTKPFGTHPDD